jgi:hypothetical protein
MMTGAGFQTEGIVVSGGEYCHKGYTGLDTPAARMDINVFLIPYLST